MNVTVVKLYRQVLLETTDGIFAVSVSDDVQTDAKRRIVNPAAVFAPKSLIVAVEQGVMPAGKYQVQPNPFSPSQEPETEESKGPRYGVFSVEFTSDGKVRLRGPMPALGQLT